MSSVKWRPFCLCLNVLIGPLRTKSNQNTISTQENTSQNSVWKMTSILSQPRCVKQWYMRLCNTPFLWRMTDLTRDSRLAVYTANHNGIGAWAHFTNNFSIKIWMMEISLHCNSILGWHYATNFCTCQDSCAVVACAKICIDQLIKSWLRTHNLISIKFELHRGIVSNMPPGASVAVDWQWVTQQSAY